MDKCFKVIIPSEFSESIPYGQQVGYLADAIRELQEQIIAQNECIIDLDNRVKALEENA